MGIIDSFYRQTFIKRYDDNGYVYYASAADYPGLGAEPVSFMSGENRLKGYFYSYEGCGEDDLIVFCHGIGGGHRSYMAEIETLCKRGYRVLAYDNTGCFESEGEDVNCLGQSLGDLDSAIKFLKSEGIFAKYKRVFVMGHSWGGFAAENIAAYQDGISKIVVISGSVSVRQLLEGFLPKAGITETEKAIEELLEFEKEHLPEYCDADARDAVNKGNTEYLFIHSKDDNVVVYDCNTALLQKEERSNVSYLIVSGKFHNPNYEADAVKYMNETFGAFAAKEKELETLEDKKNFFKDTDWKRMTAQDMSLWEKVFEFLK